MYELHRLGWNSFQQLCQTVCREILGQTVESFLDSNDAGRDGAFAGTWSPSGAEQCSGRFVIQCKFTADAKKKLRPSDLRDEISKVEKLVLAGQCDVYVLLTNAGISGVQSSKIESLLKSSGVKHVLIFGSTWISQQIKERKNLRMHVPRLYGLGDLSQILDERAYSQARAVLDSMREDLSKVVVTACYGRAVEALDAHGFVMLIGEPAAGKTTIASMLAMAAADKWGASLLKLSDPGMVHERWNPDEPSQFFWIDDAFGILQYESTFAHGWNHILPEVKSMLRKGAKIVMTSRDYIYSRARRDLKESAFPLFNESQVVIDVHELSAQERQQILYNHLKLGNQPHNFISKLKPHLELVAAHERFIPEIGRRLAEPQYTKNLTLTSYHLAEFVDKREQLLQEVVNGLDRDSLAALGLIYMRKDHLESPIVLLDSERDAIHRLGSDLGSCITALNALKGSLVVHQQVDGESVWRFKHPTIGDAYAAALARSPDLLGIFLLGSATETLIGQVTCGDVGIERAVVLPKSLFPLMLKRLSELTRSNAFKSHYLSIWGAKDSLHRFLARRCSKAFLTLYVEENPTIFQHVAEPTLRLSYSSEVSLAVRLHETGLLPEEVRTKFVDSVSDYAISGDDLSALDDLRILGVFTPEEHSVLVRRVHDELLPQLSRVREREENSYAGDEDAVSHMENLVDAYGTLKELYSKDVDALAIIQREIQETENWVNENDREIPQKEPRSLGATGAGDKPHGDRSIFDDVDQ